MALALALAGMPGTPVARATSITVNTTADTTGGPKCSLRDAITAANTNATSGGCPAGSPGMDTIGFNLGISCLAAFCTISLSSNLPLITEDLTIDGGGYNPTLNGNGLNVLAINGAGTVNLAHLSIINGTASNGGGINNGSGGSPANLTVTSVTFGGNQSNDGGGDTDGGGAIKQWGGTLNVVNSTFQENTAAKVGGAIQATGAATVIVSGSTFSSNTSTLSGGAIDATAGTTLIVTNSKFDGNQACVPSCTGGAINQAGGPLTVTASSFISNTADVGGAISHSNGTAVVASSTFTGNQASLGGAMFTVGYGSLSISDSSFDGNLAGLLPGGLTLGKGGAILTGKSTTISGSAFSNNHVRQCQVCAGATGGAIAMESVTATLTISGTTLADNISDGDGGGLELNDNIVAALTNVTLSGNTAQGSGGGIIQVKDINSPSSLRLNNVTIANNTADSANGGGGHGGGIFQKADANMHTGTISVLNSIIAGNFDTPQNAGGGPLAPDCAGTLTDLFYNLLGRNDGCSGLSNSVNGNLVGTSANPIDPRLGLLADNGGPTLTQALLAGSPAINAGNPLPPGGGSLACATTDQRGVSRPVGPRCDIGAYEALSWLYMPFIVR